MITVNPLTDCYFLVTTDAFGQDFGLMSKFPSSTSWKDRSLKVRINQANIAYICNTWPAATWQGGAQEYHEQYLTTQSENLRLAQEKTKDLTTFKDDYNYHRLPFEHQQKAFLLSRDREHFALFMEQGTGKTKVIIDNAVYLHEKREIDFLIVVAWPNGVHVNWIDNELPKDLGVPAEIGYWSPNYKTKYKTAERQKILVPSDKLKIFTFNIEAVRGKPCREFIKAILTRFRCMLVIDQSACIANHKSQQTKFFVDECAPLAKYRRILDGSPVAEGAEEFYSQMMFLDENIIGHTTWTGFKNEYCVIGRYETKGGKGFEKIEGYKNIDQLKALIDPHCFRVRSDECQDLPEKIYKRWWFHLSSEERRVYDELKTKDLAFFRGIDRDRLSDEDYRSLLHSNDYGKLLEVDSALVKNMRLQQVSAGWFPFKKEVISDVPIWDTAPIENDEVPSRLTALLNLLKQDGKALIFSRFKKDLPLIAAALNHQNKEEVALVYGGHLDKRRAAIKAFMEDDDCRYLVGNPRTMGIGLTLTAAKHVVFYANHDSLRLRYECEKRAYRQGLINRLIIWDLTAYKTTDSKITRALIKKEQMSRLIHDDPSSFFLSYDD